MRNVKKFMITNKINARNNSPLQWVNDKHLMELKTRKCPSIKDASFTVMANPAQVVTSIECGTPSIEVTENILPVINELHNNLSTGSMITQVSPDPFALFCRESLR